MRLLLKQLSALLAVYSLLPFALHSQIDFAGSTYSENFNTLRQNDADVWTNNQTITGWFVYSQPAPGTAVTQYTANSGAFGAPGLYSFGSLTSVNGVDDRTLGVIGQASQEVVNFWGEPIADIGDASGWIAVGLRNMTGSDMQTVTLRYDGKQWRVANNQDAPLVPQQLVVEYGIGDSFRTVSTWVKAGPDFDFTGPLVNSGEGDNVPGAKDGNSIGLVANLGGDFHVEWGADTTLWIRWADINNPGTEHGLGIDNVRISAETGDGNGNGDDHWLLDPRPFFGIDPEVSLDKQVETALGQLDLNSFPMIYTPGHGWIYVAGPEDGSFSDGAWFLSLDHGNWWYSSSSVYPWVYDIHIHGWMDSSGRNTDHYYPDHGLLYYGKFLWAERFQAIESPFVSGALFQIYWSDYELEDGIVDWSLLETAITPWLDAGKSIAIRMMWSSSGYWPDPAATQPTPEWVWEKGAVHAYHTPSGTEIPLFWDPVYQHYAFRFLEQLRDYLSDREGILFIDITPGAETNPYRFGTIDANDPGFRQSFINLEASDGRKYSEELWEDTVIDFIDGASNILNVGGIPSLVTLNVGGMENSGQFGRIGAYCTSKGVYVGQNGLRASSYLGSSPRLDFLLEWSGETKIFHEMVAKSGGDTGTLLGVMEAAGRANTTYLVVYPEDVTASLVGSHEMRAPYIDAMAFGSGHLRKIFKQSE